MSFLTMRHGPSALPVIRYLTPPQVQTFLDATCSSTFRSWPNGTRLEHKDNHWPIMAVGVRRLNVFVIPHMVTNSFRNGQSPYGKFLCSQMVIPVWLRGSPYGNVFYMGIFTRLPIWAQTLFWNGLVTELSPYRNGYPLWCGNPHIDTWIGQFLIPIW